jgi:hypothetical protein
MTMYSASEVVTHAYWKSGLIGDEEALTGSALSKGLLVYRSRISGLAARGISINNGSTESMPEEWLDPVADYIGMFLLSANGGAFPSRAQLDAAETVLLGLAASSVREPKTLVSNEATEGSNVGYGYSHLLGR